MPSWHSLVERIRVTYRTCGKHPANFLKPPTDCLGFYSGNQPGAFETTCGRTRRINSSGAIFMLRHFPLRSPDAPTGSARHATTADGGFEIS